MNQESTPTGRDAELLFVAEALHSAAIHLLRRLRRTDTATGASPARLSVLSVLVFVGPKSLGQLATAEQVQPPTMTRLIQGLEADGLVRRLSDPRDRRVTRVEATHEGVELLHRGRRLRIQALIGLLQGQPAEVLGRLGGAAQLIETILQQDTSN